MIKFILKQGLGFFLNVPYVLASIVPRRKNLWLFGSWYGQKYLDNPKYIYLFAVKQPDVDAIWLTKNKELYTELRAAGLPVTYSRCLRGIWLQLRCSVVVFTHAVQEEFIPYLISSRVFRVQTWHGVPIKKIGYDDEKTALTRKRQKLIRRILPYRTDRCDLVLATNQEDQNIYRSAFNVEANRVVITGCPRNDAFFTVEPTVPKVESNIKRVIYMPTFRGEPGSEFPLLAQAGFDYLGYDKRFEKSGVRLGIKLHPIQILSEEDERQIKNCKNIKVAEECGDIYMQLSQYDVLVTDYSGIYFDFMLTGKPILMAPFDIDSYLLRDRSMYYDYEDICPSTACLSWDDVLDCLIEKKYDCARYNRLAGRFHIYKDGESSRRAFFEIMKYANI